MIDAGLLDRQINIRLNSIGATRSTDGGFINTLTTLHADRWANIKPITGREFWAGDGRYSQEDIAFTIRYSSQVTVKHHINYASRDFDIKEIIPINHNHELVMVGRLIK